MNLRSLVATMAKTVFGEKSSMAGWVTSWAKVGRPQWTEQSYEQLSRESYMKCVVSFAAVRMAARGASKVKWVLRTASTKEEIEDPEHPLLKLLNKPNPWQSGASFWEAVYAYRKLNGNAYIEGIVGDSDPAPMGKGRPPDQLWVKRPDHMKVVAGDSGVPMGYVYEANGQRQTWDADEMDGSGAIIHWKTFHPLNDWYGFPEVVAGAWSIDQHNEASVWNKALLQNSGAPSGMVSRKTKADDVSVLTPKQFAQLKGQVNDEIKGAKNAGNVAIFDGGLEWTAMGLSPREMDWIEGKHVSAREIALAHGTPPMLLGIPGDNTYSNQKEAKQDFYENTVLQDVDSLCDELNMKLAPLFGDDLEIGYDEDEIPALAPKRAERWLAVTNANWLTTDEKREATGYEPLGTPEAEAVLIPSTLTPLDGILDAPTGGTDEDGNPINHAGETITPAPAPDPDHVVLNEGQRLVKPPGKKPPPKKGFAAKARAERRLAEKMIYMVERS